MSVLDFLRSAPPSPLPPTEDLELVITTGVEGMVFAVEARTGPLVDAKVAGRLAVVARGANLAEEAVFVPPEWKGRGVEAVLRREASEEAARRRRTFLARG